ncbi:4Fe-4S ferredoxin [candidate division KSB3 bacterium]|uniref:4Fe-4S ferredoxin n=1 Tax=candidate division KSB3 bacterium TaxID=2044937 RepID=A0A2G6KD83_9BACT|nr:MAG: 4Fe-4S ferredoxin [candidate division KSB3 bacterium]
MTKVYLVQCPDYAQVEEKMQELLHLMGGFNQFARPGERLVLKPNLLTSAPPEKAATTHPAIVAAIANLAAEEGAKTIIADSPGSGFPYTKKTMEKVYRACGMTEVAEKTGAELNFDMRHQRISFPDGKLIRTFEVISPILNADGIINLCKLKTHGFLYMTGAVKNSFGVIPGLTKPGYHAKLQDTGHFANMCLDLSSYVSPRLSIMDAIVGMEGNGPHNGHPRPVGFLLASTVPLALDIVAAEIMGLERDSNPILLEAETRGLHPNRLEEVEVIGLEKSELRISGFTLPSTMIHGAGSVLLKLLGPLFRKGFTVRPQVIADKCVACGACRDACPVHVIFLENHHAVIRDNECIRCYCCHEMCAHDAIELCGGFLYNLFHR